MGVLPWMVGHWTLLNTLSNDDVSTGVVRKVLNQERY